MDPVLERRARTGAWSPWRDKTEQASFRRALMERAGGRCEYLYDGILRCPNTEDLQAHHGQHGGGMLLCKLHHRELDKYAR